MLAVWHVCAPERRPDDDHGSGFAGGAKPGSNMNARTERYSVVCPWYARARRRGRQAGR